MAYRRRQYYEAKKYYQESLAILKDLGERARLASILVRYGEVYTVLGENDLARESLLKSLRLAQEIGADNTSVQTLFGMAALLAAEGEKEQSVEILAPIIGHPALENEDKKKVADLLSEIQEALPSPVFQTALETGKIKSLEDLVRDILRSDR